MIKVSVPEIQAYEWRQANKDHVQILRQHTNSITNERVFTIDYVSQEIFRKEQAITLAKGDWSNQYWSDRGKKTVIVWRSNEGTVWALHPVEFLSWLNSFQNDHDFMMNGYDFFELYLKTRSGKSVCVAPTWYCVDWDNHPNPNMSKKQSYTLPKWAQKLVLEKNVTKELAVEFLSKTWLGY